MSNRNPLIKIEHFATVKQFFTTYPDISKEPLDELWRWSDGCDECETDTRNCDHYETISTDRENMIQVFTWNINDKILLDVFAYPGDNQAGYVFHKNVPIIENIDMNLSIIDEKSHIIDLIKFQCYRDAAFGIYTEFVDRDGIDDQVSVIFDVCGDNIPQFLRNIYTIHLAFSSS